MSPYHSPCKDYGDRVIGCHSKCQKYAEYHNKNIMRLKANESARKCSEVNFDGIRRTIGRDVSVLAAKKYGR